MPASRVCVRLLQVGCIVIATTAGTRAQTTSTNAAPSPFKITDNSFLIEEAFNQDSGVFQNIFGFRRSSRRAWNASFTQEWPLTGVRQQFSYTVSFLGDGLNSGIGDALIHYRIQILTEAAGRPAFSPRISVILPTGNKQRGLGNGSVGWQVNLPFSKQIKDVYLHANGGVTYVNSSDQRSMMPMIGTSAVWRARPMVQPLLEALVEFNERAVVTLSPGLRGGWNFGDKQVVIGFAAPIERVAGDARVGAFLYFSYELPFKK